MTSTKKRSFLSKSKISNIKPVVKSHMDNTCSSYSKLTKEKLVKYILKYNNKQYIMRTISHLKMKELLPIAKQLKYERCNPSISKMKKSNMVNYAMRHLKYSPNIGIYEGSLYRNDNTPVAINSSLELNKKKRPLSPSPNLWNKKMKIGVTKKRPLSPSPKSCNVKRAKELFSS